MAHILATLNDADITLELVKDSGGYIVRASRSDSVNPPETVFYQTYECLGEAIKAITVFYVSEWESIFMITPLSERLEQAITAG